MANRSLNLKHEKDNIIEGRTIKRLLRSLPEAEKKELLHNDTVTVTNPDKLKLPPIIFTGKIYFVTTFENCAMICAEVINRINTHSQNEEVPIGFDMEWPFSYNKGHGKTALVQVCVSENTCHLFYIYKFSKLPQSFVNLLKHPKVKLVGINIKNDIWKLGRDFPEFPALRIVKNNCVDCGPLANKVYNRSCRWSLKKLTAFILQKKINKDDEIRKSRWDELPLSKDQEIYAATDAYVSLLLYLTIQKKAAENIELEKQGKIVNDRLFIEVDQAEASRIINNNKS